MRVSFTEWNAAASNGAFSDLMRFTCGTSLLLRFPGEHISISHEEVRGFRPSYRMLSYHLRSQGYDIDSNLPGEDRPDLAEALHRELLNWLANR